MLNEKAFTKGVHVNDFASGCGKVLYVHEYDTFFCVRLLNRYTPTTGA